MKDFANRKKVKKNISKNTQAFSSRKPDANIISKKTIAYLLLTSVCFVVVAFFYFKTDVVSIKPKNLGLTSKNRSYIKAINYRVGKYLV